VTPDLLLAGVVFLAVAICCRMARGDVGWMQFAILGFVLGAGYYVKAVMLPIGAMLLLVLMVSPPWRPFNPAATVRVMMAAFVFLVCAAPFVLLESRYVGHFSTGETGPLNYAWFADEAFPLNGTAWKASINGANGSLRHAPRVLVEDPTVLEFGSPIPGTYPLHYDASYWFAGTASHFRVDRQLRALMRTLASYLLMMRHMWALFAGVVAVFLTFRGRSFEFDTAISRWLVAWPLGACILYLFVHTEERLVAAFLVLFWLGIYMALYESVKGGARVRVISKAVSLVLVLTCSIGVLLDFGRAVKRDYGSGETPEYVRAARWLKDDGLAKGDLVAFAGLSYDAYYAHYLGIRVIAEIVDPSDFSNLNAAEFARVSERLRSVGVKAILAKDGGLGNAPLGRWRHISLSSNQELRVLMLRPDTSDVTSRVNASAPRRKPA
jgi:hypothetical protein